MKEKTRKDLNVIWNLFLVWVLIVVSAGIGFSVGGFLGYLTASSIIAFVVLCYWGKPLE